MLKILLIKTGETHSPIREKYGCFESWFARGLGDKVRLDVRAVYKGEHLPDSIHGYSGIVITGSPVFVSDRLDWSEYTAKWLADILPLFSIPCLGICYGHQLLAHALGGTVGDNPKGREMGTVPISLTYEASKDSLLSKCDASAQFHVTHKQSVLSLPEKAVLLATSKLEKHQAFRWQQHVWGLQFHPEFCQGIMRSYIEIMRPVLEQDGLPVDRMLAQVNDQPKGSELLLRFVEQCRLYSVSEN